MKKKSISKLKLPNCIDCGKPLSRMDAVRCKSCAKKGELNPSHINGETLDLHYCVEIACNNEISYKCWNSGNKRCKSCSSIGELGSMSGKHHSEEAKSKQSLKKGGTGIPYENNEYPAEFNDELKYNIRTRDYFICQECGMSEEEHLELFNKILSVHHIDYNKMNSEIENLITLCQKCNFKVNYDREVWTKHFVELMNNIRKNN